MVCCLLLLWGPRFSAVSHWCQTSGDSLGSTLCNSVGMQWLRQVLLILAGLYTCVLLQRGQVILVCRSLACRPVAVQFIIPAFPPFDCSSVVIPDQVLRLPLFIMTQTSSEVQPETRVAVGNEFLQLWNTCWWLVLGFT